MSARDDAAAPRFTPGPWEANGTAIETVATPSTVIGRAYDEREDCGIESYSEAEANARLIAAAPDLYAALRGAEEELRLIRMKDTAAVYNPALSTQIAVAIAAAEGRRR